MAQTKSARYKHRWTDGSYHSISQRRHEQNQAAKTTRTPSTTAAGVNPEIYAMALKMATSSFAPAIKAVRDRAIATETFARPGGLMDQAYDRSNLAIREFQTKTQDFTNQQVGQAQGAGQAVVGATTDLGNQQVGAANQAANLYGQTGAAAEAAAKDAKAAALSQGTANANLVGNIQTAGRAQSTLAGSLGTANEARRGESRLGWGREHGKLISELADLRTKRGTAAIETATSIAKDLRNYALAAAELNVSEKNSQRDYLATLAGIAEQGADRRTDDENTDAARITDNRNADEDRTSRETIAAEDRVAANNNVLAGREPTPLQLAMYDVNKDGKLSPGEALKLAPGTASGGASVYVGRAGKPFHTTAQGRVDFVNKRTDINSVLSALNDYNPKNAAELRKLVHKNVDARLFDFAISFSARKASKNARSRKYPIARKWLPFLKDYFNMSDQIPADLAKWLEP